MARRLDPEGALDPRARPTVEELFALVHQVNPTDRGLSQKETARRYVLKSRLQSLLIERYGDQLRVEAESDEIVVLRHVSGDRDAGHAVLAQLDDDARSWVRMQLDARAEPAPTPTRGPEPGRAAKPRADWEELVEKGRASLETWDYDAARAAFEAANTASGGRSETVLALVELLSDTLGDDAAALQVNRSTAAQADPAISARLAVCAARAGQPGLALRLLAPVPPRLAADARVHLARIALDAGNVDGAARMLQLAREGDPTVRGADDVAAAIAKRRLASVEPLEAELHAADPGSAAAEDVARRILEVVPDHAGARAAMKRAADRSRSERRAALISQAEAAVAAGDLDAAARGLAEAAELGADTGARMAAIELEKRARARRARVAGMVARLRASPAEGLVDWLDVDPSLRAEVASATGLEELAILGDAPKCSGSRARALADAALALVAASIDPDPELAEARLEAHAEALKLLPSARTRRARIATAARDQRNQRVEAALGAAEAAFVAGDVAAALAAIAPLPVDARVASLRERASALEAQRRLEALSRDPDPFVALRAARTLGATERIAEIEREIVRRFEVEVAADPSALHVHDFWLQEVTQPGAWLLDADHAVVAVSVGRRILVRAIEVASGRVVWAWTLRTEENFDLEAWHVHGDRVWLVGKRWLLGVTIDGRLVERLDLAPYVPEGEQRVRVLPVGRSVWIEVAREVVRHGEKHTTRIVDLDGARSLRELFGLRNIGGGSGSSRAAAYGVREGHGIVLYTPAGDPVRGWDVRIATARALVPHPDREGAWIVAADPISVGESAYAGVCWAELVEADAICDAHYVPGTLFVRPVDVATSRLSGVTAIVARRADCAVVTAVALDEEGTEESWSERTSSRARLASHAAGAHAYLVTNDATGLRWHPIDDEPPDDIEPDPLELPSIQRIPCTAFLKGQVTAFLAGELSDRFRDTPKPSHPEVAAALVEERRHEPDRLLEVIQLLRIMHRHLLHGPLARAAELWPRHPGIGMIAAEEEAREGRWPEMLRRLLAIDTIALGNFHEKHYWHLLGLAHWHAGDVAGALRDWEHEGEGECRTDLLRDFARLTLGQPVAGTTTIARLWDVWTRASAAPPLDALRILDEKIAWSVRELRIAGMRARLWLELPEPEPGSPDAWRRLVALAGFLRVGSNAPRPAAMPFPGAPDGPALHALAVRVAAALRAEELIDPVPAPAEDED